ncbi:MAG: hypothetical protein MZW92_35885 [Comamonadaceae bacterium]|nr:hypothetical protein [Comamonadaceae bacterium]
MITGLYSAQRRLASRSCASPARRRARGCTRRTSRRWTSSRIAKPVTKWAVTVREPALVPRAFQQAFHLMRSGRPGPGADRPAVRRADGRDRVRHRHLRAAAGRTSPPPRRKQIEKALDMLAAAEKPLIVAGGGIINADAARPAGRVRRTHRRAGDPDADGLGHDPRRPPADGRHVRPADQPPLRQRDACWRATSCSASATAGPTATPARSRSTPRAASSCTWTSSRRRSAASSCPTSASSRDAKAALELFVEVARERKAAGALTRLRRLGRPLRRAQAADAPQDALRPRCRSSRSASTRR